MFFLNSYGFSGSLFFEWWQIIGEGANCTRNRDTCRGQSLKPICGSLHDLTTKNLPLGVGTRVGIQEPMKRSLISPFKSKKGRRKKSKKVGRVKALVN